LISSEATVSLNIMKLKVISRRRCLSVSVGAMVIVGGLSSGASALTYLGGYDINNVQIRISPSSGSTALGWAKKSDDACLFYTVTGQSNGGSTTWWWTKNQRLSVYGYSPGSKLYIVGPLSSC
jgi:hypothetical protein